MFKLEMVKNELGTTVGSHLCYQSAKLPNEFPI